MLSAAFRDEVVGFVSGGITLDELEDWFLPQAFDLIADPSSDDADLAGAVELCLAEMQDGIRSEQEAAELLRSVLAVHGVTTAGSEYASRWQAAVSATTVSLSATNTYCASTSYGQPDPVRTLSHS